MLGLGLLGGGFGRMGAGGGGGFVPLLDAIDNLYFVYSAKRVLTAYDDALYQVIRDSDQTTLDVLPGTNGWPSTAALVTFAAGAQLYLKGVYNHTDGLFLDIATSAQRPLINLDGANPVWDFDGATHGFNATAQLAGFSRNRAAASVIVTRQHDVTTAATDRFVFYASTPTAGATRIAIGPESGSSLEKCRGRRLDANSIDGTTGFALNTNWAVQIARYDFANSDLFHDRGVEAESDAAFQTAGSSQDTASASVFVGSGSGSARFNGKMTLCAGTIDKLSDAEVAALI